MKQEFSVDPHYGFAAIYLGFAPAGYRLIRMERKGNKAFVWYKKVKS
jgi:hypothetical protein